MTAVVSWAAGNGDRSENADYQYGKRRLREIDRRIRFLTRRVDLAEVIDPALPRDERTAGQVFFGATVRYATESGDERVVTIVGVDESDHRRMHISWISPLARALTKARAGDTVTLRAPGGTEELEILDVRYGPVDVEPFVAHPGLTGLGSGASSVIVGTNRPVRTRQTCTTVIAAAATVPAPSATRVCTASSRRGAAEQQPREADPGQRRKHRAEARGHREPAGRQQPGRQRPGSEGAAARLHGGAGEQSAEHEDQHRGNRRLRPAVCREHFERRSRWTRR